MNINERSQSAKINLTGNLVISEYETKQQLKGAENFDEVELDMSFVEYLDSSGVRLLANLKRTLETKGGILKFVGAKDHVKEVLDISGINQNWK